MSCPSRPEQPDRGEYDPVFLHSRREAIIIFCVWLAGFIWAVPFCRLTGYDFDPQTFTTVWGIPTWLFWGIFVPWIVADVFTIWFCICYMKDDDLGECLEGDSSEGENTEFTKAKEGGA